VSWAAILALAAGAYAFKVLGVVVLGGRELPDRLVRCVALLPAALVSALIVVATFGADRALVVDARAAGVAVAAVAAWRRAPFPLVIVLAAAVTATIRALS
jgi:branched-subunit amino acid transport protein